MNTMTSPLIKVFIVVAISALIVLFFRAFPFLLFSKRKPPAILRFIEQYIPPMIIAILIVYCLKDVDYLHSPFGVPQLIALCSTVLLHLWKKNSMISIFGGTILFMVLDKLF